MTTKMKTTLNPEMEETPDDFDFELPHFTEAEAGQAWLDSLPRKEVEVDERLKKRVPVTMNFHQCYLLLCFWVSFAEETRTD